MRKAILIFIIKQIVKVMDKKLLKQSIYYMSKFTNDEILESNCAESLL